MEISVHTHIRSSDRAPEGVLACNNNSQAPPCWSVFIFSYCQWNGGWLDVGMWRSTRSGGFEGIGLRHVMDQHQQQEVV